MNIFDKTPDIPACPHCGHDGDGLNWAFPDPLSNNMPSVQCACLMCGVHGARRPSYAEAIEAFVSKTFEHEPSEASPRATDAGRDAVPSGVAATPPPADPAAGDIEAANPSPASPAAVNAYARAKGMV